MGKKESTMRYSLATLWHERGRYLAGVLAVAFSALIVFVPTGVLLGLFNQTSAPIDCATADIWVGHPGVKSIDLPQPIPERWLARLYQHPDVDRAELYLICLALMNVGGGRSETCTIIGTRLDEGSLGLPTGGRLSPRVRGALGMPSAFAADSKDKLGLQPGAYAEIHGQRLWMAGPVERYPSLAAPYVVCSEQTARSLIKALPPGHVQYLLARCKPTIDPRKVVAELNERYPDMKARTREDFAARTRLHWFQTAQVAKATLATAILAGIVGVVVTGLILYAATAATRREYAVLQALGIPRWRVAAAVLAQAAWVGGLGIALALPAAFGLQALAATRGLRMDFPAWLLAGGSSLTVTIALLSGLYALRALRLMQPADLLR
jgi:putative ABC transport system permease protein